MSHVNDPVKVLMSYTTFSRQTITSYHMALGIIS